MTFAVAAVSLLGSVAPTPIATRVEDFDLAKVQSQKATCAEHDPTDDIVVCAPKNMNFAISGLGKFPEKPVRATFVGPLNAEATVHAIKTDNPFARTPAAAVTLKWHF